MSQLKSLTSYALIIAMAAFIGATATPVSAIPVTSTGALGTLDVTSGSLVFDTDFTDPSAGGTYSIDGMTQTGSARIVTLPATEKYGVDPSLIPNVYVYDFSNISIGPAVSISVIGAAPLILLSSGSALLDGSLSLVGAPGANGGIGAGGGGGGGGGSFSVFATDSLVFGGVINVSGGDGGLSNQAAGSTTGGSGGIGVGAGGDGGAGGFADGGGHGGKGADGALMGFSISKLGLKVGLHAAGGGGGGGGGYAGGAGGPGDHAGTGGDAGQVGFCPNNADGGAGGDGAVPNIFGQGGVGGTKNGGKGGSATGIGGGGGGGGGGDAPIGQPGGAAGAGSIAGGGGGGGGGGDLCVGQTKELDNGGGGGSGGGDGKPGTVIQVISDAAGAGGGGQVFLGTETGTLIYAGTINAVGGTSPTGAGGDGLLTVVVPTTSSLFVTGTFNGTTPFGSDGDSVVLPSLDLQNFFPFGGGGGGGAGGPGQAISEPGSLVLLGTGLMGLVIWRRKGGFGQHAFAPRPVSTRGIRICWLLCAAASGGPKLLNVSDLHPLDARSVAAHPLPS